MMIRYKNLTIRQADVADAKQLTAWWNDGTVMAHAGFPYGLGTSEEDIAEIGIKICENDCQNRGVGRKCLSMPFSLFIIAYMGAMIMALGMISGNEMKERCTCYSSLGK